jgi:hypothetical protein
MGRKYLHAKLDRRELFNIAPMKNSAPRGNAVLQYDYHIGEEICPFISRVLSLILIVPLFKLGGPRAIRSPPLWMFLKEARKVD